MFSTWDLVRPTLWHPMSMLEQSMMDFDLMANQILGSNFPMSQHMISAPSNMADDEFFKDLPVAPRGREPSLKQPEQEQEGTRAFSSYSYNNSSVVDDKGNRVLSTRRRYEDSTGRLKAVHERHLGDRHLKTIWNRKDKDSQGEHHTICSSGTAEDFEKLWAETPFGQAQEKKHKELKEGHETEKIESGKTSSSTQKKETAEASAMSDE